MENKLREMFPSGQWCLGNKAWMVKDGTYFCAAADIVAGEIVLTELGKRLSGGAKLVVAVPEVVVDLSLNDELEAILNAPEPAPVKRPKKPFG